MAFLEVRDLHVRYGAVKAVRGISFSVDQGEIVTIIGANGAGKSTIMNTLAGLLKPAAGTILLDGKDVTNLQAHAMVAGGAALSPEGRQIFPRLTVRENLALGAYLQKDKGRVEENYERVFSLFPRLKERIGQMGGTLSGGEQQMLAVARALMCDPRLLMLDEPSLGLAPIMVQELFALFARIQEAGTMILLVEQNARMALQISDRGYVLETGRIVLSGTGRELRENRKVRDAYLGGL
ncbi:MAG: ABC transporter ATP-binding protein [Oscillibacter sp.]|nr:ABC transporter ATP-binding protein [Oscillibacter sp.]